ncbi:hypothetical protein J416_07452 [Gracilibacillus halophilus YIM-C55.5]|uniref:Bypass-of-forespore protein C n=1 Tax=Gracilibacillus halophilus YIM-C55.5 TaxID=1308866 RepID=N4WVL1_9BACI|nr:BofC C-terminal domain-containing protein [Gracilibacillus halophilus]ENH97106.1 hypothetical protein J416_07452 [Gracilibacillus halophilus YIM-C55.5]
MKRYWVHITILSILMVATLASYTFVESRSDDKSNVEVNTEENTAVVANQPVKIEVTLEKHYIDGKVEKEQKTETVLSMPDFWASYQEWNLVDQSQGHVHFRQQIDDISPYTKAHGYFGIKDGILTIFEGVPVNDAAVQSFYQIETEELETRLYNQLKEGIKINSKQDYTNVLETYRPYQDTKAVNGDGA